MRKEGSPEKVIQEIRPKTRRRISAEEKIRIVLEGLRSEEASPRCVGKKGWPRICTTGGVRNFLEAGKKRLVGDTTREATSTEVTDLRK